MVEKEGGGWRRIRGSAGRETGRDSKGWQEWELVDRAGREGGVPGSGNDSAGERRTGKK
jgi:hypothetical protein